MSEIYVEFLLESKIGKNLKYFIDFCKVYSSDYPEIEGLKRMSEQILMKWKNYINNTFFDENADYTKSFVKSKNTSKKQSSSSRKSKNNTSSSKLNNNNNNNDSGCDGLSMLSKAVANIKGGHVDEGFKSCADDHEREGLVLNNRH